MKLPQNRILSAGWKCALLLASVALGSVPAMHAAAAAGTPEAAGFSSERLQRLDAVVQAQIDQKHMAGAVVYIARDGKPVHFRGYGLQEIETGKTMPTDAIFRIASMSKALTTTAIMMLYEEGKFMLHDPVAKFIPAFAKSSVAVAPPAGSPPDVKFVLVPAKRPIQIRDLLTHTAGLTYGDGLAVDLYKQANVYGWYFADKNESIATVIDRLATLPLHGQPGETWQYGFSVDVLGRLVEVASGMPLDQFFQQRIFGPLKMVDSGFFLPPEKASRLAPVYGYEKGELTLRENSAKTDYIQGPRTCFSGGAGVLSTTSDYARFLQMLLNGGELDGVRLLGPKSVELMHANHTGEKYLRDSSAFGLGFWVNDNLGYFGELGSEGAYGWGSAYFPQYVVDPKEKIVAMLMTQLKPAGGLDLNQKFKVMMYQALIESRSAK